MKLLSTFVLVAALVVVGQAAPSTLKNKWEQFKLKFGKEYESIETEKNYLRVFEQNLKTIEDHNKRFEQGLETFKMGVNKYTDLTEEEFRGRVGLKAHQDQLKFMKSFEHSDVEFFKDLKVPKDNDELDWRKENKVTPVRDQGEECNASWAFAAVGAIESRYAIANDELYELSAQNLIDCTWEYGNRGCNDGFQKPSFLYVINNGIGRESDYPYTGSNNECTYKESDKAVTIQKSVTIPQYREDLMEAAVLSGGPIAISLHGGSNLRFYESGILTGRKCDSIIGDLFWTDALIVGYGQDENESKFWIVKNSWGSNWGEDGYVRVEKGAWACGIANFAVYPVV